MISTLFSRIGCFCFGLNRLRVFLTVCLFFLQRFPTPFAHTLIALISPSFLPRIMANFFCWQDFHKKRGVSPYFYNFDLDNGRQLGGSDHSFFWTANMYLRSPNLMRYDFPPWVLRVSGVSILSCVILFFPLVRRRPTTCLEYLVLFPVVIHCSALFDCFFRLQRDCGGSEGFGRGVPG